MKLNAVPLEHARKIAFADPGSLLQNAELLRERFGKWLCAGGDCEWEIMIFDPTALGPILDLDQRSVFKLLNRDRISATQVTESGEDLEKSLAPHMRQREVLVSRLSENESPAFMEAVNRETALVLKKMKSKGQVNFFDEMFNLILKLLVLKVFGHSPTDDEHGQLAHLRLKRFPEERETNAQILKLLHQWSNRSDHPLSIEELIAARAMLCDIGIETLATNLTWAWALLAVYPEQRQHEPKNILFEAARLFPPIWQVRRWLPEPVEIEGRELPGKRHLDLMIYFMNRDPDLWIRPSTFDPSRFSSVDSQRANSKAFYPFGKGERNCVAQAFALSTGVLILQRLLAESSPILVSHELPKPWPIGLLYPYGGLLAKF